MRNGAFEGTEMVTGERVDIGRDPSCALVLDDESCSRRHAVIFEHEGKLAIQDLGSANGTRVNGEPVPRARYIGARDDIAIGVFTVKVKLMTGGARPSAPEMPSENPTRVMNVPAPVAETSGPYPTKKERSERSTSSPRPMQGSERSTSSPRPMQGSERSTSSPRPVAGMSELPATEAQRPSLATSDSLEGTLTAPAPPPVPPASDESSDPRERPTRNIVAPRGLPTTPAPRPQASAGARLEPVLHTEPLGPDVTAPEGRLIPPQDPRPMVDFAIPDGDAGVMPTMSFRPQFLEEELHDEDNDDPPWSLVQRLLRPTTEKNKNPLLEVVHYRGEVVVDHQVLHEGDTFKLGEGWSRGERKDRGIPKPIPLVRLKKGGVAEVFQREEVQGKLLRNGQQADLPRGGSASPITDGELASLKVGNERVFIRFAGTPQLIWTKEDAAEDRFTRRVNGIASGASMGFFAFFAVAGWIYQYRNADQEVIALEDEGFAEVEMKDLKMDDPPPEPEKAPEPIESPDPVPEQKPDKAQPPTAAPKNDAPAEEKPAKPGVLDILNSIPKVNDSASSQNLNAALSNIKGVRVPGAAAGVKVSSLMGKGPTSGVQIGGAAGGLNTSGINSLIRKDGAAGALSGKGDRAIQGKVTTLTRQTQTKGQGELSKEEILKVINSHIGEIQYCYEKQLRSQPGLSGRVVLEWTVKPDGRVSVVKVNSSQLASAEATNCMMGKLKSWTFPKPRGGAVTIVFPFVFNTV